MGNKTWKAVERGVCRYLGGDRQGPIGREGPDCAIPGGKLAVQIKHRENLPTWLLDMVDQTLGQANSEQFPLLVLHPFGRPIQQSLVIVTLENARILLEKSGIINKSPDAGKEE